MALFAFVALAACLAPFALDSPADAQQPVTPRHIGVLLASALPEEENPQAFREGLREAGYIEGRDVVIEWRSAKGDYGRLPELCADLVQRKVDVIVVDSTPGAHAAKRATTTIPIIMTSLVDPIASGLVAALAHPGGTGANGPTSTVLHRTPLPQVRNSSSGFWRCPELL